MVDLPEGWALSEMALRLGVAAVLGCVLGLDREVRGKSAGMRTHMLIALGAATTAVVTMEIYDALHVDFPDTRADPLRMIEGVMTGVGFLGAGAIIRSGGSVHGMTSAANIWICGAIGLACGAGFYQLALVAFGFAVLVLTGLWFVEKLLHRSIE
ncbi:putative Mg2+ transporter-C (MgtC) family protein [Constrictibacter sp. MBR-5]|jgi:putative Mg2+ transporter-C (MgtC) family protein|uniref:MgtC/SapB family protein n=1 Tax=Constrictibacter sp. MBR-5 TaxID=3156467 RepID=UPI0033931DC1